MPERFSFAALRLGETLLFSLRYEQSVFRPSLSS